jgi:NitT/TauT family transport system permease protein
VTSGTVVRRGHPEAPSFLRPFRWRPSERLVFGVLGFAIVLIVWEAASRLQLVRQAVLSRPTAIVDAAITDATNGVIWPHLQASAIEYILGFGVALAVGIPVGLGIGMFRRLNWLLDPWLSAIYATPTIALVPLIILILGLGLESKVFIVWLEAIFVIVVTTMVGVRAAEARYLDLAKSFRASRWLTFRSVILPSSFPYILTALRLGVTRALVGVVVAEFFAANKGLGFFINFSGTTLRTDRVMLGVILLGLLGVVLGEGVRRIERRYEKWRPEFR